MISALPWATLLFPTYSQKERIDGGSVKDLKIVGGDEIVVEGEEEEEEEEEEQEEEEEE